MNYGLIALIILQVVMVGACFFVYSRMLTDKSTLNGAIARVETVSTRASEQAADALRVAESLEVTHYKALQARQLALETEAATTATKVQGFVESVANLSARLSSREKVEKKAATKEPEQEPPGKSIPQDELEALLSSGAAYRMDGQENPGSPVVDRMNGFGRKKGV